MSLLDIQQVNHMQCRQKHLLVCSPHVHQAFNCRLSKPSCRKLIIASRILCMQPENYALPDRQYQKQALLSCNCTLHACMLIQAAGHKQSSCTNHECGSHMIRMATGQTPGKVTIRCKLVHAAIRVGSAVQDRLRCGCT